MASEKKTGGDGGKVVELKKPDAGQSPDAKDAKDQQTQGDAPGGSADQAPTDGAAAAPPPPPPANTGKKQKALAIRAKGERFRRAGLTFGREPSVHTLADLSEDQVAALRAEPQLVVEEIEL